MSVPERLVHALALPALLLFCSLALVACGSNPPPASNLTGVWQLTGDPVGSKNLAVSVVIVGNGNQITGTGIVSEQCTGQSQPVILSFPLTGGVDPSGDGFFSVASQPQGVMNDVFNLKGQTPKTAQQPWTGTYSVYAPEIACDSRPTGNFTAAAISSAGGTYAGTLTENGLNGTETSPGTVSVTLQLTPGTTLTSAGYSAQGTLTITGSSCFASGTQDVSVPSSLISADSVTTYFRMDDGSQVGLYGLTNAGGTAINAEIAAETGSCAHGGASGKLQRQ